VDKKIISQILAENLLFSCKLTEKKTIALMDKIAGAHAIVLICVTQGAVL
jgi:hypothetical protein